MIKRNWRLHAFTAITLTLPAFLGLACAANKPTTDAGGRSGELRYVQQTQTQQPQVQLAQAQQAQTPQPRVQPQQAATGKPKVAVYVTGGKTPAENKALTTRITHALVNSGRYNTIEREDAFLDQVAKEMAAQRSGAIDDRQISELGRQAGANFVCVGEILEVFGDHQVSARIINVVTVEVIASGVAEGALKNISDFAALANSVVGSMLGVTPSAVTLTGTTAPANQTASVTPPPAQRVTVPVTTANTFTDPRDNQTYRIVKIGNLTWMAQNLNFRKPRSEDNWCYDDDNSNCDKYGRLYTWDAAMEACPAGWRLPTRQEWEDLTWADDNKAFAGSVLKSKTGWTGGNGTDKFGFSALPGGVRNITFGLVKSHGYWWSATNIESGGRGGGRAWGLSMGSVLNYVSEDSYPTNSGRSVRCVRQ